MVTAACAGWNNETTHGNILARLDVPKLQLLAGFLKDAADHAALVKAGGGTDTVTDEWKHCPETQRKVGAQVFNSRN